MATGQRALTEGEFEEELEFEDEGEEFLGTVARGGGLLGPGQGESEDEMEFEGEFEEELEFEDEGEEVAGAPRGGSAEFEDEYESEDEAEEFLRRARGWLRRAAPVLRQAARIAAPLVGTAVGGPLGGILARGATQLLREGEFEFEDELEDEFELEGEFEDEAEEMAALTPQQALAEMMAAVAARAATEAEAEAMIGAATLSTLSARERAELERVLASLVRGSAVLVRVLWRRSSTRPAIRVVPTVVRGTARKLVRQAATGRQVTPRQAARVMARQTYRVLGQPRVTQRALGNHARGTVVAARRSMPAARAVMPGAGGYRRPVGSARATLQPRRMPPQRRTPATRRQAAPMRAGRHTGGRQPSLRF
ncbi:hypothetical protein [Nucisporomicrobium flavum]|uniref:hypothetical protein n=1 Tax=Nucisporomicrobium flavum TaxID=2785915 RepID=UPI0018F78BEE|nr:hypothetical protein [Nucisporomicrobium flavum]